MNTRERIDAFMKINRVRKPKNYDSFADDLASYVDKMGGARIIVMNKQHDNVRKAVRNLWEALLKLPPQERTFWFPLPDTTGKQRDWVDTSIEFGEELQKGKGQKTRTPQIEPALRYVAELWEKYYGEPPKFASNSKFLPLFNELFPQLQVSRVTAEKIIKRAKTL